LECIIIFDSLFVQFAVLAVSFTALFLFSDRLIESSARIATAYGVSESVIGLTLLAYGTSLPELTVTSLSSVQLHPELAVSNVVGSNLLNITIVLGSVALLHTTSFKKGVLKRDALVMTAVTFTLLTALYLFNGVPRIAGILMVASVFYYTIYVLRGDREVNQLKKDRTVSKKREAVIIMGCFIIVIVCGKFAVDSAVSIASALGVSEWLIGVTIIAAGSSLPELAVSMSAARKQLPGMVAGNIIGSNIINILWILGFASILHPLSIDFSSIKVDSIFLMTATFLLTTQMLRGRITRLEGVLYLGIYLGYLAYLIV
jgi:cation:H+ antiporter